MGSAYGGTAERRQGHAPVGALKRPVASAAVQASAQGAGGEAKREQQEIDQSTRGVDRPSEEHDLGRGEILHREDRHQHRDDNKRDGAQPFEHQRSPRSRRDWRELLARAVRSINPSCPVQ
jgi:hypothetical protein